MRIAFHTLGCKVNRYETELLSGLFHKEGFDIVSPSDEADVYVINSCTVTATGDAKSRKILHRIRREHPGALIALTGCFPQAFPEAAELLDEADVVTGAGKRRALVDAVGRALRTGERIVEIGEHTKEEPFEEMRVETFTERTRAFVKIEDGCERYCAYCIIPKARGYIRSKKPEDLREELEALAANGYKEAVLVGINLSSYGQDLGLRLTDAVETACSVEGIERVRLSSLEPELLTDGDIERLALQKKLCPQFHLSLQSGCDETLKRMRRHYDTAEYRRIVSSLRRSFPGCAITTDIMVGFPGETKEEFARSLAFVREIGFAKVHVFAYSPRGGTPAAQMPDQVPPSVKEERSRLMILAARRTAEAYLSEQIGKTLPVLFESRRKDSGLEGYAGNYVPVAVRTEEDLSGTVRDVRITGVSSGICEGELV